MGIHEAIVVEMPALSYLECECGNHMDVGNVASYLRDGWPICCTGHTMTLVTVRQVMERHKVT